MNRAHLTYGQHKALERRRMRRKLYKRLDAKIGSDWRTGARRDLHMRGVSAVQRNGGHYRYWRFYLERFARAALKHHQHTQPKKIRTKGVPAFVRAENEMIAQKVARAATNAIQAAYRKVMGGTSETGSIAQK